MSNTVQIRNHILILKTNIKYKKDLKSIAAIFNDYEGILRWTIDQEDIDKVLRIESRVLNAEDIISLLEMHGYNCEELPD